MIAWCEGAWLPSTVAGTCPWCQQHAGVIRNPEPDRWAVRVRAPHLVQYRRIVEVPLPAHDPALLDVGVVHDRSLD